MTWIKQDDKLYRNPKARESSDAAFKVWVLSWSYCGDMPDPTGFMTTAEAEGFVRSLKKPISIFRELVDRHMWDEVEGGYMVHEFEQGLPKLSTPRVQKFRELKRKRNVSVTGGETFQNVSPPARAVPEPEPVPEPVPGNASKKATPGVRDVLTDAIQNGHTDDLALELAKRVVDDVLKRDLNPLEVALCEQFVAEYAYLGVDDVVERMQSQLAWAAEKKLDRPSSLAWFTQSLRIENEHRADAGQAKAWRPPPIAGDLSRLSS